MKIEIKFRVWDEDSMFYVLSVDNRDVWMEDGKVMGSYSCWYQRGQASGDGWWVNVEPEFLMQYIGIEDKNNVEIYEGDIVNICRHGDVDNIYQIVIEHMNSLPVILFGSNFTWCEVVGNIHEKKTETLKEIKDITCPKCNGGYGKRPSKRKPSISPITGQMECEDCNNEKLNGYGTHCKSCGMPIVY